MTEDSSSVQTRGPILQMKDLRIEATGSDGEPIVIVDDVSLDLNRGEVLGLIGESGAGKSTIALAAMAYCRGGARITGGTIDLDGRDILSMSPSQQRRLRGDRIAYVAQSAAASFNPARRLMDQVCEAPVLHGLMTRTEARRKAKILFEKIRVPDPETFGDRYPHQVSGGQLQRAMTAMAMMSEPDILILDEPTTALDVTTQIEILAAIRDVIEEYGTAALYITHDLAVVAQISDRIMVLRYGQEVETGETGAILDAPQQAYTRDLLAARRFKAGAGKTGSTPLLSVRGVDAAYGSAQVLFDVSAEIREGETVAVVGESGSGKSTLARVVTGLLPPTGGSIDYRGVPLSPQLKHRTRDDLRGIQMIYQMPDVALNPRQTVYRILSRPLAFYLGLKGKSLSDRVDALLDQIELGPEYRDRLPAELSGGQKQRICIARALAAEPDLIICDEVTSALDQIVAGSIVDLLQRLQRDTGVSYLFITHDLGLVKAIADSVVVMLNGAVVESGPKAEIFSPPHHDYTDLLLNSVPEMRPDWLDDVLRSRKDLAETR